MADNTETVLSEKEKIKKHPLYEKKTKAELLLVWDKSAREVRNRLAYAKKDLEDSRNDSLIAEKVGTPKPLLEIMYSFHEIHKKRVRDLEDILSLLEIK